MIVNLRRQYPVGQGCFHGAFVGISTAAPDELFSAPGIRYVYDCGAMPKHKKEMEAQIDSFHSQSFKYPIDFLFLSHLHADHLSGVEKLCGVDGCAVDTIVLPLLNVVDRLICFARALAEDPSYDSEFHTALTVDPVRAVARFNPRQIILLRRGGEGGAPSDGEASAPDGDGHSGAPDSPAEGASKREGMGWKLIGTGRSQQTGERVVSLVGGADDPTHVAGSVFEVDDTCAMALGTSSQPLAWILAPYVDTAVSEERDVFLKAAAKLLGTTSADFEAKAMDAEGLLFLLSACKAELSAAYAEVAGLNVTSLCLYSGPFHSSDQWAWNAKLGKLRWAEYSPAQGVGWLGTGDADLKKPARLQAFLNHYTVYLPETGTFLLPHHGSEHNFRPELLDGVDPRLPVAAAAAYANWRHPGTAVIQAACSRGAPVWVVTNAPVSRLEEFVFPWTESRHSSGAPSA